MTKHEKEEMRIKAAVRCWIEIEGGTITHIQPQMPRFGPGAWSVGLKCGGHGWINRGKAISSPGYSDG